jgi:oligopeptide/dipeptide ABC transporter ATP-binding protein
MSATAIAAPPVLELRGGSVTYREPGGGATEVVTDVSLTLRQGEILGLVGESGCGKSTTARAMLGLAPLSAGTVFVHGEEAAPGDTRMRSVAQAIFQNPTASFNPKRSLVDSVIEPLRVRGEGDKDERRARALAELERVGISEQVARRRPREVSGGQCQRAAIARATVLRPEALICDEPVSALDVSIQAQILALLAELRAERGIAMLFISHDLSVVASLCDRTAVMCAGKIVETGDSLTLSRQGRHPYTVILHDSVPTMGAHEEVAARLEPNDAADDVDGRGLPGCRFAALCPRATEECDEHPPELLDLEAGHGVACFHPVPTEPQGTPVETGA